MQQRNWKSEAARGRGHESAKVVPESAILTFHRKAMVIATEHGLTAAESETYERTKAEIEQFRIDALERLENVRGDSVATEACRRCIDGRHLQSLDIVRNALAKSPELLERYENLLKAKSEQES